MIFLKNNIRTIIGFIVGVILASSITVYAYNYIASDISYTKPGTETAISVEEALNELYSKSNKTAQQVGTLTTNKASYTFKNVKFINCKLAGCNFESSYIQNSTFSNNNIKNSILDNSNISNTTFIETTLKFSSITNVKLKSVTFDKCDLSSSDLANTKLYDIDLSNSTIDAITIYADDIKGCILNEYQALEFVKLLGIKIRE